MEEIKDFKLLLDTSVLAGQIMLQNGAEIYRVEDTIHRMLKVSGFKTAEAYVTPTGLIVTLDDPKVDSMTVVKRIDTRGTDLNKITIANEISRKFCVGEINIKEAFRGLKHMQAEQYTNFQKQLCNVLAAIAFCVLLGGDYPEVLGAGIAGACMVLVLSVSKKEELNYFMQLLLASAMLSLMACLTANVWRADMNRDMVIIGGMMPIVPGAAITTAVRDTLQGDYVAGGAKALEAFVRAAAIAIGAWTGMMIAGGVFGC